MHRTNGSNSDGVDDPALSNTTLIRLADLLCIEIGSFSDGRALSVSESDAVIRLDHKLDLRDAFSRVEDKKARVYLAQLIGQLEVLQVRAKVFSPASGELD